MPPPRPLLLRRFLAALLCGLLLASTPLGTAELVPGASGTIHPRRGSTDSGEGARWRWSFLDPTPAPAPAPPAAAAASSDPSPDAQAQPPDPFPFTYGVADQDPRDVQGGRFVPARRYGHAAVARGSEEMILTHGYHYAMGAPSGSQSASAAHAGAIWLSDTWSLSLSTQRWRRLHPHVTHPSQGPPARYGAVAAMVGGDLFLHGGDDGGHASAAASYGQTAFGDLWRLVLTPSSFHSHPLNRWVRVRTVLSSTLLHIGASSSLPLSPLPLPPLPLPQLPRDDLYRAQHAGVLAPMGRDDAVWQADETWEEEQGRAGTAVDGSMPYWFVSHGLSTLPSAPPSPDGSSKKPQVLEGDELFVFSFRTRLWRMVRTVGSRTPDPRFGHAMTYVPDPEPPTEAEEAGTDGRAQGPSGSIVLYGGFSRSGKNFGDLWRIRLQPSRSDPAAAPAFEWVQLHPSFLGSIPRPPPNPGPRAFHSLLFSPVDRALLLFGGARCEPGCVTSGEVWRLDLQAAEALASTAVQGRAATGWTLLAASPHSPSSRNYPSRSVSGAPRFAPFAQPDESVRAGWPLHRYKHTMVRMHSPRQDEEETAQQMQERLVLFGGESYFPSAYLQDAWLFEYAPPTAAAPSSPHAIRAARRAQRALDTLLHATPLPCFERPLPSALLLPPSPFHAQAHTPPGGWGPAPPQPRSAGVVLEWRDPNEPTSVVEGGWGSVWHGGEGVWAVGLPCLLLLALLFGAWARGWCGHRAPAVSQRKVA